MSLFLERQVSKFKSLVHAQVHFTALGTALTLISTSLVRKEDKPRTFCDFSLRVLAVILQKRPVCFQ